MSKAKLLFKQKLFFPDGAIAQTVIWQLPSLTDERRHGLKYSLYYGRAGERIIGYDNERGKCDHRHYRDREEVYLFSTVEQLINDFSDDVRRERGE